MTSYLTAVDLALRCDETFISGSHARKGISNKVRFGVIIPATKNMSYCKRICCHKSTPTDKAVVNKCGSVSCLPSSDKTCVFLVMHFPQVTHKKGRRRGARKKAKRR